MYVCFAWRLWNVRNDRVWNDNSVDVLYLFSQVQAYVQEWWFVNDKYNVSKKSHGVKVNSWNALDPNKWKFNVDAASFKETNMFGWGGVRRNHMGEVQAAILDVYFGGGNSSTSKAKALEFAMRWAIDNGVKYICFELDAQRVVQAMKNSETDIAEFGVIINRCKNFINDFVSCTFSFVSKDCNKAAHMFARSSIDFGCCMIWMKDYPSFIQSIILNEMKK